MDVCRLLGRLLGATLAEFYPDAPPPLLARWEALAREEGLGPELEEAMRETGTLGGSAKSAVRPARKTIQAPKPAPRPKAPAPPKTAPKPLSEAAQKRRAKEIAETRLANLAKARAAKAKRAKAARAA